MSLPDLSETERQAVLDVVSTPNLSMGPKILEFEAAFQRLTGCRHAIAVNSGTAGVHLCVCAAGINEGDLVITTPFSFVASTNAILFERGVPVFVDVDPRSGNIDSALVEQAARDLSGGGKAARRWLPRRVAAQHQRGRHWIKAIMAVDIFGQPADFDSLQCTAHNYGLKLIEDSCEALGATYQGRPAGSLGDYGVFGFYPNKQITTGEGGMVVTNDGAAADLMRALRNQGRAPGDTWLQHTYLGYNYRLDELSAALGAAQMSRLEDLLQARQRTADWYAVRLVRIPGVEPPFISPQTTRSSWFVYVIRLERGIDRKAVASRLAQYGVPVRPYFSPIHLQPYMIERYGYRAGDYPVTEDLGARGLALPFSGRMSEEQVEKVCQALARSV